MSPKTTLLIGGGHTHVVVLRRWIKSAKPTGLVILISEYDDQYYSGMLPGMLSGFYKTSACRINLGELCAQAGVQFIKARAAQLNLAARSLKLSDGRVISYDQISLDTGSITRALAVVDTDERFISTNPLSTGLGDAAVLQVKPLAYSFQELGDLNFAGNAVSLTVVGGGAAGFELALALKYRLEALKDHRPVNLVSAARVLNDQHSRVQRLAAAALRRAEVLDYRGHALIDTGSVADGCGEFKADPQYGRKDRVDGGKRGHLAELVTLRVGEVEIKDTWVLNASGAAPPEWLAESGLALDQGFVAVDRYHRSISHPEVFAAGDVCARQDVTMARSGVHAVKAARAIAHNLGSEELIDYTPHKYSLYLLSLGEKKAILSYGPLCLQGRWVWQLKDWIDRRFVEKGRCGV